MNDYRGLLIKKQRKALDISLEALSHGVCSPSYLSKIENNILVANDDIYNLLFKKLGISTMDTIKEEKLNRCWIFSLNTICHRIQKYLR